MQRAMTNILSSDIGASARFYRRLLGMADHYTSDWFIILTHPDMPGLEFGILQADHEIVPEAVRAKPSGVMLTFVVEDCDAVFSTAGTMDADIVEEPRDLFYGQRRLLLRDPDGTLIDISAPIPPKTA